jgi:thiol-disulfide isomerase/thioredoxin
MTRTHRPSGAADDVGARCRGWLRRSASLVLGAVALGWLMHPGPAQAGVGAVTPGAPVAAVTAADGWEESLGLEAVLGDSVDALARIFDSPDYQRQLLVPGSGDQAYLLGLKDQEVMVLPRAAVAWTPEDQAVPDAARGKSAGKLAKLAGEVTFDAGGGSWTVRPAPPLVGPITLEALRKAKPDYVRLAEKYTPDAGAVKSIASAREARIVVFFGSWCLLCKKEVPRLLKTIEAARNPSLGLEFYGVTEDHLEPKDPITKYSISTTPTFIVVRGGKELGRLTEKPDVSVEKDLALILAAK